MPASRNRFAPREKFAQVPARGRVPALDPITSRPPHPDAPRRGAEAATSRARSRRHPGGQGPGSRWRERVGRGRPVSQHRPPSLFRRYAARRPSSQRHGELSAASSAICGRAVTTDPARVAEIPAARQAKVAASATERRCSAARRRRRTSPTARTSRVRREAGGELGADHHRVAPAGVGSSGDGRRCRVRDDAERWGQAGVEDGWAVVMRAPWGERGTTTRMRLRRPPGIGATTDSADRAAQAAWRVERSQADPPRRARSAPRRPRGPPCRRGAASRRCSRGGARPCAR